jgi:hypothetical protein
LDSFKEAPPGRESDTLGVPKGFLGSPAAKASSTPAACAAMQAFSACASPGRAVRTGFSPLAAMAGLISRSSCRRRRGLFNAPIRGAARVGPQARSAG